MKKIDRFEKLLMFLVLVLFPFLAPLIRAKLKRDPCRICGLYWCDIWEE